MFGRLCRGSVLSLYVLFALPALSAPNTIAPGRSIGRIHLGDLRDNVVRQIGREPDGGDAASGQAISAWFAKGKRSSELEVWTSYYADFSDGRPNTRNRALVEQVRVTSPYFHTLTGLGVGSRWQQLAKVFPQAKQVRYFINSANKRVDLYDDPALGIAFEVVRQNKGTAGGTCDAVLVHPRNASVLSTGLWFYPGENGKHLDESYLESMSQAASPQRCLADQVPKTALVIFSPLQGGSQDPHPHATALSRLTGMKYPYQARTRNQRLISRLLKTLYYTSSLNNGQHWNSAFYYGYLEEIPKIDMELDTEDHGAIKLQLFLEKYNGHYWLERQHSVFGTHKQDAGGTVAVTPASLHRFLFLFRSLASQAKQGKSQLEVYYPQGD